MRVGRSSLTAQATTLVRALESRRPAVERLLEDGFAYGFLDWTNRTLLRLLCSTAIGGAATALLDRLIPGTRDSVVARTLHIDHALRAALAADVPQVVILGAGFDSRSLRISGIERARVFEVDHPATQARKRSCLARMLPSEPAHVSFVALDFDVDPERERLEEAMAKAGFREDSRTFFVWEGVTEYLSAEAVDRTLRFVSTAEPGSTIAFSYKNLSVIRDKPLAGVRSAKRRARLVGEPWIFGLDPTDIATFLAIRGLMLLEDVVAAEREARHLPASRRPHDSSDLDRTVLAEIRGAEARRSRSQESVQDGTD